MEEFLKNLNAGSVGTLSLEKKVVLEQMQKLPPHKKLATFVKNFPKIEMPEIPFFPKMIHPAIRVKTEPWHQAPAFNPQKFILPEFIELLFFLFTKRKITLTIPENTMLATPLLLHKMWGNADVFGPHTELVVEPNATATVINFQHEHSPHLHFLRCRLKEHATLHVWNVHLGSQFETHVTEVLFEGANAVCENHSAYFGTEKSVLELFTTHVHQASGGTSRIHSHGIQTDEAFARYDAMIRILQTGVQTDAFLEEKTLLLSDASKIDAVPGLEIGTNDVKAAHSASMTRIDEEQLFYAASRGINEKEAVKMIAEGFLGNALQHLPSEEVLKLAQTFIHETLCR